MKHLELFPKRQMNGPACYETRESDEKRMNSMQNYSHSDSDSVAWKLLMKRRLNVIVNHAGLVRLIVSYVMIINWQLSEMLKREREKWKPIVCLPLN